MATGSVYQRPAAYECTFVMAPQCHHDQLFDAHYQRANRLNQTKILRCFPHCCPEHVSRSYCGSSVWLRVTQTTKDPSRETTPTRLLVFARFRTNDSTAKISLNDPISLPRIRAALQSEHNTCGEWISSELVSSGGSKAQPTWLFEINSSRRWYYAWRSGKMSARRLTAHVLEAVVVADTGISTSRVAAVTKSSPFTIVSFRRSRDTRQHEAERTLTVLEASLLERFLQPPPTSPEPVRTPPVFDPYTEPQLLNRSLSSELSVVFSSMNRVRLEHVYELVPAWSSYEPAPPSLLKITSRLGALANFVWSIYMDTEIQNEFHARTAHARRILTDINELEEASSQWTSWLKTTIEKRIARAGLSWSELTATAHAKAARYVNDPSHHCFDRESFIARVRQSAVFEAKRKSPQLSRVMPLPCSHQVSETVDGKWKCQLSKIAIAACEGQRDSRSPTPRLADVSVSTAIALYQQLSQVRIKFDQTTAMLELGSGSVDQSHSLLPCRLTLDGRLRCFNCLPHGESTLTASSALAGQCFGDYTATYDSGGSMIDITCYSWPVDQWVGEGYRDTACKAYRWRWTVELDERGPTALRLTCYMSTACIARGFESGFQFLSARDRLQYVDRWDGLGQLTCHYDRVD